jgi:hypothetical protein
LLLCLCFDCGACGAGETNLDAASGQISPLKS